MMFLALASLAIGSGIAPSAARLLGPQRAVSWDCELRGPAGEPHRIAGVFAAPDKVTQGSYGSHARVSVIVEDDSTGLLIGRHQASGSYAIPRSFSFGVVAAEFITLFSMSYFGGNAGGLVTLTQNDAARHAPSFSRAIGTGYCRTVELDT